MWPDSEQELETTSEAGGLRMPSQRTARHQAQAGGSKVGAPELASVGRLGINGM